MKEMTFTRSEAYHFFEFLHGPMSMANGRAMVIGLLSGQNREHGTQVLREMAELGGYVSSRADVNADISVDSGLPEPARNV